MFAGFSKAPQILTPLTLAAPVQKKQAVMLLGVPYAPYVKEALKADYNIFEEGMDLEEQKRLKNFFGEQRYITIKNQTDFEARTTQFLSLLQMGAPDFYGRKWSTVIPKLFLRAGAPDEAVDPIKEQLLIMEEQYRKATTPEINKIKILAKQIQF